MTKGRRIFKSVSVLMIALILMTEPGWNTGMKALAADGNDVNTYAAVSVGDASKNKTDASSNTIKRQPGEWGQSSRRTQSILQSVSIKILILYQRMIYMMEYG